MKPAVNLAWALLLVATLPACSDKSHRLNESEALRYKQQLLREHPGEISPAKMHEFGMVPARTKGEIDRAFDRYREEYAAEKARAKAELDAERRAEGEANTPGSGPPGDGG